jgi:tellurite resistance protein
VARVARERGRAYAARGVVVVVVAVVVAAVKGEHRAAWRQRSGEIVELSSRPDWFTRIVQPARNSGSYVFAQPGGL